MACWQALGMVGVFNDDIAVCQHSFNVAVSLLTMGTKVAFVVGSNRAEGLPVFLRMDQNGVIFGRVVIQNSVQHLVLHFDESEGLVHAFFVFAGHNGNDIAHKTDMAVDEQVVTGTGLRERLAAWVYRGASCGTSSQVKIASMPGTFLATAVLMVLTIALAWGERSS